MEGLWYTHFTAGPVHGDGLAVLRNGEILGGDPAHTYSGSYNSDGPNLYAQVRVSPHVTADTPSDLDRPVNVFFKGSIAGDSAIVIGHPDRHRELNIAVELHRAS
jgi:hypothetical protein